MAVIWLLIYVFVNLTSIIYLGALAISSIAPVSFQFCVIALSLFSVIVTLGGMKVIGYTDMFQVIVLILGGLVTTYLALTLLSDQFGFGKDILKGLAIIADEAPGHLHMILDKSNPHYNELPGMSVLVGGMLINNLAYWGCNQYIVQRALGADLKTARKGILFAAFLKLLVPIIAVLPGIAMFVMHSNGMFQQEMVDAAGVLKPDHAYPTLMNLLPAGLKGVALAALTAAIVASLAGKANSISTIFSLDIYKKYFNSQASEKKAGSYRKMVRCSLYDYSSFCSAGIKIIRSGVSIYTRICGILFAGSFSGFLIGNVLEKNNSFSRTCRCIINSTTSRNIEIPAYVDRWRFS